MPYWPMLGFNIPRKFSLQNGHSYWSVKVFSLESFPLYVTTADSCPNYCTQIVWQLKALCHHNFIINISLITEDGWKSSICGCQVSGVVTSWSHYLFPYICLALSGYSIKAYTRNRCVLLWSYKKWPHECTGMYIRIGIPFSMMHIFSLHFSDL